MIEFVYVYTDQDENEHPVTVRAWIQPVDNSVGIDKSYVDNIEIVEPEYEFLLTHEDVYNSIEQTVWDVLKEQAEDCLAEEYYDDK